MLNPCRLRLRKNVFQFCYLKLLIPEMYFEISIVYEELWLWDVQSLLYSRISTGKKTLGAKTQAMGKSNVLQTVKAFGKHIWANRVVLDQIVSRRGGWSEDIAKSSKLVDISW